MAVDPSVIVLLRKQPLGGLNHCVSVVPDVHNCRLLLVSYRESRSLFLVRQPVTAVELALPREYLARQYMSTVSTVCVNFPVVGVAAMCGASGGQFACGVKNNLYVLCVEVSVTASDHATLTGENGVRGIVNGATGQNASFLFELLGSKGHITISETPRPAEVRLYVNNGGLKEKPFPELPEEAKIHTFGIGRCVIPLAVEEIIESIEQNKDTISSGRDGYAALEMLLSFHESERTGNNRVDYPMQNKDISVLVRDPGFISSAVPAP